MLPFVALSPVCLGVSSGVMGRTSVSSGSCSSYRFHSRADTFGQVAARGRSRQETLTCTIVGTDWSGPRTTSDRSPMRGIAAGLLAAASVLLNLTLVSSAGATPNVTPSFAAAAGASGAISHERDLSPACDRVVPRCRHYGTWCTHGAAPRAAFLYLQRSGGQRSSAHRSEREARVVDRDGLFWMDSFRPGLRY